MAKKESKKSKQSGKKDKAAAGAVEAVEAVRAAVERTFAATAEGAQSLRGSAQDLAGDVAVAANRIREVLEDRVLDELKGLRGDIENLGKRVAALEVGGRSIARKPAAAASKAAAKKPAAKKAAAKKAAAKKPAAKPGSTDPPGLVR